MKLDSPIRLFAIACAAVAMSTTATYAQSSDGGPARKPPTVEERLDRMKKDLEITDEQAGKIKPLLEDLRSEMDKLREEAGEDRNAMREKGRKLWEETRAKIDEVLTPEQKAKAEKLRSERRGNRSDAEAKKD